MNLMHRLLNWLRIRLELYTFSTRLILGMLLLVLVAAASISVPAQLLARQQLRAQAWATVRRAQAATQSLLLSETTRLANSAELLSERPTLRALLASGAPAELDAYLADFRQQSELDVVAVCRAGTLDPLCRSDLAQDGALLLNGQPLLVAQQPVDPATFVIVGQVLDAEFLALLAADTGVVQTIVGREGRRYIGALVAAQPSDLLPVPRGAPTNGVNAPQLVAFDERLYFAGLAELPGTTDLLVEVALPIDDLIATERRTLLFQVGSTLLVATLALLIGGFSVRRLVAPLRRLTLVAEAISDGDVMTPIPIFSGPQEISTLATAFHKSQANMLRTLEERAQARDWLNALIQSVVEGVITIDRSGTITFFSQGAELLSGRHAGDVLNTPLNELFADVEGEQTPLRDLMPAAGQKRQIAVTTPAGKRLVVAVTAADLPPTLAVPAQTVLVLRDVTQEAALRDLRVYFLANISHEFRTPLSTIQAALEMLLSEDEALSADEMRELLRPSYLSLVSLRTLIDNLLASSRIEAGQFVIRPHPCALERVLADSIAIVRPLLDRRRQILCIDRPDRLPQLDADGPRLTQVLVNLLTNAAKYSPLDTTITLSVWPQGDRLTVAVDDRGPGIAPAERVNLFRRFVRLNNDDREQYGVGLGLYVVKTVVEAHGGQIRVENNPHGGARFQFELPLPSQVTGER